MYNLSLLINIIFAFTFEPIISRLVSCCRLPAGCCIQTVNRTYKTPGFFCTQEFSIHSCFKDRPFIFLFTEIKIVRSILHFDL